MINEKIQGKAKILIVDDDKINISLFERALHKDYDLCSADNGETALTLMCEERPDLVLLDVMMPGMSGFEVIRAMKTLPGVAELPVIFVTALDHGESESEGLELGAVDYIHKPFDVALTKLRIRNHVERKQQRDQLKQQKLELEGTLARIKRLEGIISICMYCKQIRNSDQAWQQIEVYISEHSEAEFSHGICPSCKDEHFPNFKFRSTPDEKTSK
jgi:response regulator RpfG family c-di-GMP phosphodiesterase